MGKLLVLNFGEIRKFNIDSTCNSYVLQTVAVYTSAMPEESYA